MRSRDRPRYTDAVHRYRGIMITDAGQRTVAARLRGLRAGGLFRSSLWGISDQALISGSNFVTMVLLARGLGPAAFGSFALAYTAMLFANSTQTALITQPHNVLGVAFLGDAYRRYTSAAGIGQVLLVAVAALVALVVAGVGRAAGWGATPLLFALAPAIVAWQLQEFVRRVLYTEGRLAAAFANNLISYGGQVAILALLWRAETLSGPAALYVLAGTSAVAAACGVWQLRNSLARSLSLRPLRDNWRFGRWLWGGEFAFWGSSGLYYYLTAAILSAAATGSVRACNVLTGPIVVLLTFLDTILPIRFARTLAEGGERALRREVLVAYAATAPLVIAYSGTLFLVAAPLLDLVYGDQYAGYVSVLRLIAVEVLIGYATRIVTAVLKAQQRPQYIFYGYVVAAIVAISTGWWIIQSLGPRGAVLGWMITWGIVGASCWYGYARSAGRPAIMSAETARD